jgi:hypothetical protein
MRRAPANTVARDAAGRVGCAEEIVVTQSVAVGTADPLRRGRPTYSGPTRMEAMRIVGTVGMADSLQNFRDGVISHETAGGLPEESSKDGRTSACARDCAPVTHYRQGQARANRTTDR